ncbi:hypothetical protein [Helicovermis profundi]|uniref:Lysophospholipid acyltransferase family protein n=1 Tax=Helicovermis profundi TaxID=3065157 RepID=A0AAU9E4M4_9FIRM|nr:lysophospholipid acyltransferase family protein [Clostridia bacterium S502]
MGRFDVYYKKIISKIFIKYIDFVFKTSKIIKNENFNLLKNENKEKYIVLFWHGDSYSLNPFLKGESLYVITTADSRGDYITDLCNFYGYKTFRVPDETNGEGNFLRKIRKEIDFGDKSNLAVAMDGPLGPFHEPKSISFVLALLTKRKVIKVSIHTKCKISLYKRWDNYSIPLPFNTITIGVSEPIEVDRDDRKNDFLKIKELLKNEINVEK